ncbi:TetR/AcrR family transcriptional regulator [Tepidimicrobium xylanilyticum]|uniref:Transcriptional regulator, TetR family n=1 Tax=Tepidimicrobium xylanilyticum TaxID=1123352 RepID=A0A1H2Q1L7_9FIRM|nr:TetR/AcrR family transcriptional regulator [Tepidimicrobium xylanilyticum]GMG95787.1 TetR family transcriptional regulator [Tepidimicrobium xylanilyticum]SDW00718.1 transcriptional regulator, TetR family [Tepidimicrobium xylanilyticum]
MPKKTFFNLSVEKRNKIIDAAYDLFIENDYKDVSIRNITNKAGISIGSFYQYFYDKDDLYLYIMTEIEKKIYARHKERTEQYLTDPEIIPIEEVCSPKEIALNRTWYDAPVEVKMKFYFGEYSKEMNSIVWDELVELEKQGKLVEDLDLELIFHLYVTTMFNILMYFDEKNITDEEERIRIKRKYYTDWFINGILKKR